MPYVVGTYRDKIGSGNFMLIGDKKSQSQCEQSIRWQVGPGHTGRFCNDRSESKGHLYRTSWHICDPAPDSPFTMVCRVCGEELTIERGGQTWEAYHKSLRAIWGAKIPLTVAELRLSLPGEF